MSGIKVKQPESLILSDSQRQQVVFCTYPSLYSDIVLDELLRADQVEVVGVVTSTRVLRKNYNHLLASVRQVQQSGLRYATYLFVVTSLYSILQYVFQKPTLQQRLHKLGIPMLKTQDINDEDGLHFLQNQQPDILLSAHFNQLIKAPILEMGVECLNIHPSLLPAYKGVDPAFYAMLRREQVTGATVHVQDQDFDSGEILQQQSVQIRWHDSLLSLNMKLFKLGAISAVKQITDVVKESAGDSKIVQPGSGNYDSWPNPYDAKQFRQVRKFFRWKELIRFIRRSA
uniref:Formyl transferase N-terminal domain-containing protein n=1 Tax=uncultured Thiotrichaceae bacterium TaxID=298394 RepID=A0A6S6UKV6_9GAMM|nr:MAG: Unknown protein [uncultured Thiotrichaceae bacterium]